MALDVREAQTTLENLLRDTIRRALGRRLPQVASVVALRAVATTGERGPIRMERDLITVDGDPLAAYEWSQTSRAADDGAAVIKPTDAGVTGRWLLWTSLLRFAPDGKDSDSVTLDQVDDGPLDRVIVLDKDMTEQEVNALLTGAVPAVLIDSIGDDPKDELLNSGFRWNSDYEFTISALTENLRDDREAAQGSSVSGESAVGANTIDGLLQALLCGTQLCAALGEGDLRNIRVGRGHNWVSELRQGRVVRSRTYVLQVTVEYPNATNELVQLEGLDLQSQTATLAVPDAGDDLEDFDLDNFLAAGCRVPVASGLTQDVSAGSAVIAGLDVVYDGETQTFSPYTDTYRDLSPDGTLTFVEVPEGGEPPPVTADALRIGVTKTFASAVVGDEILAATKADYMNSFDVPL